MVIAIMGILMSVVLPYLPGDKRELLYEELDRFRARVAYAQTHAVLQSQDLGLAIEGNEYRFLQRAPAGWQALSDEPLQPQQIPEFLIQKLFIEGQEMLIDELPDEEVSAPRVLFLSSGEMTPFNYQLALSEQNYSSLEYDPLGEVKQETVDEAESE